MWFQRAEKDLDFKQWIRWEYWKFLVLVLAKFYINPHYTILIHPGHSIPSIGQVCMFRVLARIIFKRNKKHVATTMTHCLREIFLVKCQKEAFSFNKREAKVYCYAFLHDLKIDTCIKHEQIFFIFLFYFIFFSFMQAAYACRPDMLKCPG
jgi:hypothetical protein